MRRSSRRSAPGSTGSRRTSIRPPGQRSPAGRPITRSTGSSASAPWRGATASAGSIGTSGGRSSSRARRGRRRRRRRVVWRRAEHGLGRPLPHQVDVEDDQRITLRRLGAGELFGGKGLPRDLDDLRGGRAARRQADGQGRRGCPGRAPRRPRGPTTPRLQPGRLLLRYQGARAGGPDPLQGPLPPTAGRPRPGHPPRLSLGGWPGRGDLAVVPLSWPSRSKDADPMVVREADPRLRLPEPEICSSSAARTRPPSATRRA